MKRPSKRKYDNRTIPVAFQDEANYQRLCQDGRAFVECVVMFIISRGFQLKHHCGCPGGWCLTRHTHYTRIRLGGLVIWRLPCTHCNSADAFHVSSRDFQQAAHRIEATYRPKGILPDGFESTRKSLRTLFPNSPRGNCLLHATPRAAQKLKMDRKLFMMKGFHHPEGSQKAFLTGLALLYNVVPYQRRAKNAGKCGVEVEGGTVPTNNWFLNLQILTSGGFQ